jgi:hypothetical protein
MFYSYEVRPRRGRALALNPWLCHKCFRIAAALSTELPLEDDPQASVRAAIAGHRNLPVGNLVALLADESERVERATAASPHLPVEEMERLLVRAGL